MTDTAARMAAYAEHLETYSGRRDVHEMGTVVGCEADDHCHIHHVDEPDNGDTYRTCGECGHVFVTELDLQTADVRERTGAWQAQLRQGGEIQADHSGAPTARPGKDIESCPHCTHSF